MSQSTLSAALLLTVLAGCTAATPNSRSRLALGNFDAGLPVASMLERRFATVIRQQYDFSCGSAALATLLSFHHGRNVNEQAAFLGMWNDGDQSAIRRAGFSLLDMKRYLAANGMPANGYQVSIAQIAAARRPGIALIQTGAYKHFVVLKGYENDLAGGTVLLGDPATGLRRMNADAFVKSWNGVLFIIESGGSEVEATFARKDELALAPGGRVMLEMEPVSQAALALTRPTLGDI